MYSCAPRYPENAANVDLNGVVSEVPCCVHTVPAWVYYHGGVASLVALWAVMTLMEARKFVVAGVVVRWYVTGAAGGIVGGGSGGGSGGSGGGSPAEPGALRKVSAHAAGPSFGTLCFSGAVLVVIEAIRRASNRSTKRRANRNRGGGGGNPLALACMLFQCLLVNFFAELLELLASGATMMAAVTGEDFVSAARHVTGLLRRHACSTLVVWYVPGYLLGLVSFMLASSFAATMGHVGYYTFTGPTEMAGVVGFAGGFFAFWLALIVLNYCVATLQNCIDALFLSFLLDLEAGSVTRARVHGAWMKVPGVAAAAHAGLADHA